MKAQSGRLYWFLKIATLLGVFLPLLTCLLKVCADNFLIWNRIKSEVSLAQKLVDAYPFLDLERYTFLSYLSWHKTYGLHVFEYYIRYALFAILVLLFIHLFRHKIKHQLSKVESWLARRDHNNTRRLIVGVCCALFFCYITKMPIGFYWPGVSGWTYQKKNKEVVQKLPKEVQQSNDIPYFIEKSINKNAIVTDDNRGYLKGPSQFLHFSDGQVLPFNDGLTGYVFPRCLFGKTLDEFTNKDVFFSSVKNSLTPLRDGRSFMLPLVISYPRHTVYMPIDYSTYPAADKLEKISYWEVWIKIGMNDEVYPVSAKQKLVVYE